MSPVASARLVRMRPTSLGRPVYALGGTLAALLLVTTACGDSSAPEPAPYDGSTGISARVLPRMAAPGEDTEDADDAAWVVEATLADADKGTEVELMARFDGEWKSLDSAETDADGKVGLSTTSSGELHVVADAGDGAVGVEVTTANAPEATFTDDFDKDSLAGEDATWFTRDQGYVGVRLCSRASDKAAEVKDDVLRLSVLDDPDKGKCQVKGKSFPYRLNGHVGTEQAFFTYGHAAARIKFQPARGQHGAFWLQSAGGQAPLGPKKGGAEIDVAEYFGDGHPKGGLTSFIYWLNKDGKSQTEGGWVKDLDEYGDNWASEYHVFSVEWTPEEYVFRIDDQVTQRLDGPTSGTPQFPILSLLSSDYELKNLDGDLPQHMDVDWVRVWETGA